MIRDRSGAPLNFVALAEDITALKRRARELARSNAELEQFASIASHDLQEPLRKVRTFTERVTVMEADRLSVRGRDYLQRADAAAERMQRLVQDLLTFSRVATHGRAFALVDLAQIAREVLIDLETEVERSQAIVRVGELPIIYADASQMRQLLQNLLSNALKLRREGVAPEVRSTARFTTGSRRSRFVTTGLASTRGIATASSGSLSVSTVARNTPGRGSVLPCRRIAERHGGGLVADAPREVGSLSTVTIPIGQRRKPSTSWTMLRRWSVPRRRQCLERVRVAQQVTILMADDDEDDREIPGKRCTTRT